MYIKLIDSSNLKNSVTKYAVKADESYLHKVLENNLAAESGAFNSSSQLAVNTPGAVYVWTQDGAEGSITKKYPWSDPVSSMAFSVSGKVAVVTLDGWVVLLGKKNIVIQEKDEDLQNINMICCTFSADEVLAISAENMKILIYDKKGIKHHEFEVGEKVTQLHYIENELVVGCYKLNDDNGNDDDSEAGTIENEGEGEGQGQGQGEEGEEGVTKDHAKSIIKSVGKTFIYNASGERSIEIKHKELVYQFSVFENDKIAFRSKEKVFIHNIKGDFLQSIDVHQKISTISFCFTGGIALALDNRVLIYDNHFKYLRDYDFKHKIKSILYSKDQIVVIEDKHKIKLISKEYEETIPRRQTDSIKCLKMSKSRNVGILYDNNEVIVLKENGDIKYEISYKNDSISFKEQIAFINDQVYLMDDHHMYIHDENGILIKIVKTSTNCCTNFFDISYGNYIGVLYDDYYKILNKYGDKVHFNKHNSSYSILALSFDLRIALVNDCFVEVYDLKRKLLFKDKRNYTIICMEFAQDGRLAVGGWDTKVMIYDMNGRVVTEVGREDTILCMGFNDSGSLAFSGSDNIVEIVNKDGNETNVIALFNKSCTEHECLEIDSLSIDDKGQMAVSVQDTATVYLYQKNDADYYEMKFTEGEVDEVINISNEQVRVSKDYRFGLINAEEHHLMIYNENMKLEKKIEVKAETTIIDFIFSEGGNIYVLYSDKTIYEYDLSYNAILRTTITEDYEEIRLGPNGSYAYTLHDSEKDIRYLKTNVHTQNANGKILEIQTKIYISDFKISNDGRIACKNEKEIIVYENLSDSINLNKRNEYEKKIKRTELIECYAFSEDGRLAIGGKDKKLVVYDQGLLKILEILRGDWVWQVAFGPNGRIMVYSLDNFLIIYSRYGKELFKYTIEDSDFSYHFLTNGALVMFSYETSNVYALKQNKSLDMYPTTEPIEDEIAIDLFYQSVQIDYTDTNLNLYNADLNKCCEMFDVTLMEGNAFDEFDETKDDKVAKGIMKSTVSYVLKDYYKSMKQLNCIYEGTMLDYYIIMGYENYLRYVIENYVDCFFYNNLKSLELIIKIYSYYDSYKFIIEKLFAQILDYCGKNQQLFTEANFIIKLNIILKYMLHEEQLKNTAINFYSKARMLWRVSFKKKLSEIMPVADDNVYSDPKDLVELPDSVSSKCYKKIWLVCGFLDQGSLRIILSSDNMSIYQNQGFRNFLDYIWDHEFLMWHGVQLIWKILVLLASAYIIIEKIEGETIIPFFKYLCYVVIYCVTIYETYIEFLEMLADCTDYLSSAYNIFDIGALPLVIAFNFIMELYSFSYVTSYIITFYLSFMGVTLMNQVRAFQKFGWLFRTIQQNILDIWPFLTVMFVFLVIISLMFYASVLRPDFSLHPGTENCDEVAFDDDANMERCEYENWWWSFYATVKMGLMGEIALGRNTNVYSPFLTFILIFIVLLLVLVVMLNALIAILGDSYEGVQESSSSIAYKDLLEVIINKLSRYSQYAQKKLFYKFMYMKVYLDEYEPEEMYDDDSSSNAWQGFVHALRNQIKTVDRGINEQFNTIKQLSKSTNDKLVEKMSTDIQNLERKFNSKIENVEDKLDKLLALFGNASKSNFATPNNRI